jgi:hypothetical protein
MLGQTPSRSIPVHYSCASFHLIRRYVIYALETALINNLTKINHKLVEFFQVLVSDVVSSIRSHPNMPQFLILFLAVYQLHGSRSASFGSTDTVARNLQFAALSHNSPVHACLHNLFLKPVYIVLFFTKAFKQVFTVFRLRASTCMLRVHAIVALHLRSLTVL